MLNIVVPMAGRGSRFLAAGYKDPKPFILLNDKKPMIQWVVENLIPHEQYRFIFLARREHEDYIKRHMSFATTVIYVDEVTEGAACTVLLAKEHINSNDSLIIANSDQLVIWNDAKKVQETLGCYWPESNNLQDMINACRIYNCDATIATFNSTHPKWSYAKVKNDRVIEVAEKKVISNHATVGVYYYENGYTFVRAAESMIKKDIRVNGEFYVCPIFNEYIEMGKKISIYPVYQMLGMGTPDDLKKTMRSLPWQDC